MPPPAPYTTVADHLARARRAGLGWPLPDDLDDAALEAKLFAIAEPAPSQGRPLPAWPAVQRELRRPGVTLQLLWMEHKEGRPTATSTPSSAVTTGAGRVASTWSYAKSTARARSCS